MKNIKSSLTILSLVSIFTSIQLQAAECDLAKGEKIYTKCAACHSLTPNESLMGPSLHGVINRKAGSLSSFTYSQAMADSKIKWTKPELNEFLLNPKKKLPGTSMPFSGLRNDKARAAVVCYIEHKENSEK